MPSCSEMDLGIDPSQVEECTMKKVLIATALGMLVAGQVAAQESPWLVRARVVNMQMTNDNTTPVTGLGVSN